MKRYYIVQVAARFQCESEEDAKEILRGVSATHDLVSAAFGAPVSKRSHVECHTSAILEECTCLSCRAEVARGRPKTPTSRTAN